MVLEQASHSALAAVAPTAVVIGGGPLGLNVGIALARGGRRVLILESGAATARDAAQDFAADELLTPDTHHDPTITTARRLGGAGVLWGGRCVPSDPIDFTDRPWLGLKAWPVGPQDLDAWLGPACTALGAGDPVFSDPIPGFSPSTDTFTTDRLERWTNEPRAHVLHRDALKSTDGLSVALGITVTGIKRDAANRASALSIWSEAEGAGTLPLPAGCDVILAAGGNGSTRLLLNVQADSPQLFGGAYGPLGRFYMGHLDGQIADIVFDNATLHDAMDFYIDDHGSYVRRRIIPSADIQEAAGLANIAFWPVVPEISEPTHGSGALSAVYLPLSYPALGRRLIAESIRQRHVGHPPYRRLRHLRNLITDPLSLMTFAPWFIWNRRFAKYRLPGFFLKNPGRRYGLMYHSEHLPHADSRVTLSANRERTGLRRLAIDFRFSGEDVASVLNAHEVLDDWLGREKLGRVIYRTPPEGRADLVLSEAKHGNHQEGTTRMGHDRTSAVVDGWGTTFDVQNLHVVSTSVLPTSSQANPTLTAMQLGLRLADRLATA